MSMAYTPGLKRKEHNVTRSTRRLPLSGEILVKKGDKVKYDTIVARTAVPGKVYTLNAANLLDLEPSSEQVTSIIGVGKYMLKKQGESFSENEIIARRRALFGLINKSIKAPVSGTIEYISEISGEVLIREESTPLNLSAYIPGTVVEILSNEGVVVETHGAFVQGIFGIGGETHGELKILADSPDHILTADQITSECAGKVLVTGSLVEGAAIYKAVDTKVSCIVSGGIKIQDLTNFLGYIIGVAITGHEEKGIALVITEGFGKMRMADKTLELLRKFEGRLACVNGSTQIRAGVIRPEIILPETGHEITTKDEISLEGMKAGLNIRIIREPYFGALGRIVSLPVDLKRVESGSYVRVLEADLYDGRRITVPRANVELIEE